MAGAVLLGARVAPAFALSGDDLWQAFSGNSQRAASLHAVGIGGATADLETRPTPPLAPAQAHEGGRLVGAVVGKAEPHKGRQRGYVAMLAVEKEYRMHGLGLRLAALTINKMAETCDEIVLETEMTNTAALRLYEKLGFLRDKRLPRYYMSGSDAFRMKVVVR